MDEFVDPQRRKRVQRIRFMTIFTRRWSRRPRRVMGRNEKTNFRPTVGVGGRAAPDRNN